jgi:hypothetical protein
MPNLSYRQAPSANMSGTQMMCVSSSRATRYRIAAMRQATLCPMPLILLLAGCAGSMGTIHVDPATLPVTAFDGTYSDTIRVTSALDEVKGESWCVTPGQPIITVANGQFTYAVPHPNAPGNATPTFQATMAKDGTFIGQANDGIISGQIIGTHIEGTINGSACIYAFAGDRM